MLKRVLVWLLFYSAASELVRNRSTGLVYCTNGVESVVYDYNTSFCTEKLDVVDDIIFNTVDLVEFDLNATIVNSEFIYNSTVAGTVMTENMTYMFFLNSTLVFNLVDLNRTLLGRSAWNPLLQQYWTIGYSDIGSQPKFYFVDLANNYTTGFYIISTGERPVDVYWNGTDIVGLVERNSTYFTVAFLLNNRRTLLGPVNGTDVVKDRLLNRLYLKPASSEWEHLCERECLFPHAPTISNTSSSISLSTAVEQPFATPTQLPITIITLPLNVQFTHTSSPVLIPGRLIILESTTLTLDLSGTDYSTGDSLTLYTFTELQGSFSSLEIQSSSCRSYEAELDYTQTEVSVTITSVNELCTAVAARVINMFP